MEKKEVEKGITGHASVAEAKAIENTQWTKYKSPKGGHGFAAEDANSLNDKFRGKKVEQVGVNNELNGADRISNGQSIQTKYYNTAKGSVDAGFSKTTGKYKYKNQVLEVPSDQYSEAVKLMEQKIEDGKVPRRTDPGKASEIVKKGDVTYQQARNIAEAGNIDSLWFDVKNQAIVTSYAFGISFIIQYANGIWNGLSPKQAFQNAFGSALKTGGIVLIVGVGAQQVLRTTLGREFSSLTTKFSLQIVNKIYSTSSGKNLINKMASVIMKKTLRGTAAKNVVTKFLGTNAVTGTLTAVVLSIPDIYKTIISKRISWVQLSKNLFTIGAGVGGATAGVAFVTAIVAPALTVPIAVFAGGAGASIATKKLVNFFAKDDAKILIESMNKTVSDMASEYLLTEKEFEEKLIPTIESKVNPEWIGNMHAASGRNKKEKQEKFVRAEFESYYGDILKEREKVFSPGKIKTILLRLTTTTNLFLEYFKYKKSNSTSSIVRKRYLVAIILSFILLIVIGSWFLFSFFINTKETDYIKEQAILVGTGSTEVKHISNESSISRNKISLTHNNIHFVANSSNFLSEGNDAFGILPDMSEGLYVERLRIIVDELKSALKSNENYKIIISGYCGNVNEDERSEQLLSRERAERVKALLISLGIPPKNVESVYIGGTNLWGDNLTEETIKPNRVVTIQVKTEYNKDVDNN